MSASITASTANKMEQVSVGHMEELLREIGGRESKGGRIFLLFCGDIDEASGKSWCSDCVKGTAITLPYLIRLTPPPTNPLNLHLHNYAVVSVSYGLQH